jgi:hypothetical protein
MSPLAWLVALAAAPLALGQFIRAGHRHCCGRQPLRLVVDVTLSRRFSLHLPSRRATSALGGGGGREMPDGTQRA